MAESNSAESPPGDTFDRVRVRPPEDADPAQVLEQLSDPGCRAILAATGRPRTAAELCELCEMPTSTVYRKLEGLSEAALLEETRRLRDHGNHPVQYRRRVDHLHLSFDDAAGVVLDTRRSNPGRD